MNIKKLTLVIVTAGLLILGILFSIPSSQTGVTQSAYTVQRGSIVQNAIATGKITVKNEVPVKSVNGGILTKRFVELGQKVTQGTPVAEVRPVITSRDLIEAERSLKLANDGVTNANEFLEGDHPAAIFSRWLSGEENLQRQKRQKRQAELNRQQVEEQLTLLKQGKTEADGRPIDFNVLAPVDGHVLEIVARAGAPVVASSSFGSGSVLLIMADLDDTLFLGSVDEIDVAKLREGMRASIRLGAVPEKTLTGELIEIGLKSKEINNASVFDVRITLDKEESFTLRSGYSAIAEIEMDRRDQVLVIPERLVRFQGEETFVLKPIDGGEPSEIPVQLGLSDGLLVEVIEGLSEGDQILERH